MSTRREEFVKRLSTVGLGTRESIQVLIGGLVYDVREHAVHGRFTEDEMDQVVAFHDAAEALWQDTLKSDPPLSPAELVIRLQKLVDGATGPLDQFHTKLERGLRNAQKFEQERTQG